MRDCSVIHEQTLDGDRVLTRRLVVAAVEDQEYGDWAAYVVDEDYWKQNSDWGNTNETIEEYAARQGDKLTEAEARRYFSGSACPRGEYRA